MKAVDLAAPRPDQDIVAPWVGRVAPGRTPALELLGEHGTASSASAGPHAVLFDGVLYNRAELEAATVAAADTSDAAVVLNAYERWGLDVLGKIKGIFTLAIWDGDRDLAVLTHDPLGTYPCFYAEREGEVLLSTSIDALLGCDGVSSTLNRALLADHLCHRWPDREETYFESINRVPACHALLVERGSRRLYRYWDPAPPGEDMNWVAEDELDRFQELFEQAVGRCLSLGRTGIFLSSGLDSVSVAGVAADICAGQGEPLPLAMSVIFPDPECNEELAQRAVARDLGLEQVLLNLDDAVKPHGLVRASCELQPGRSAPMLSYYAPPYLQLADEARSRGYRVIMTGGGGDEWLCVTPLHAADLIRSGKVRELIQHTKNMRRSFNLPAHTVWRNSLWKFGARQVLASMVGSALRRVAPALQRAYRQRVVANGIPDWVAPGSALRSDLERRNVAAWPDPPTDGWYRHDIRFGLDHPVAAMEMEEFFENTHITGMRTLCPFMDADLVDFLYRVPPSLLDRGGRSKGLVRQELHRRFPDLDFERHKKITAVSFSRNVVLAEGERAWQASGGAPALAELGVIDPKAFERERQIILSGEKDETFRVWDVLNLEAWVRSRL